MSDLNSVLKDISKKYGSGVAKFGADDLTVDGILSLVPETFADQYILNIPAGTIINTGDGDKYEDISIGNDAIKIIISTNNN